MKRMQCRESEIAPHVQSPSETPCKGHFECPMQSGRNLWLQSSLTAFSYGSLVTSTELNVGGALRRELPWDEIFMGLAV